MRRLYARIYLHFLGVLVVAGVASSAMFASSWRVSLLRHYSLRLSGHLATELGREPTSSGRAARLRKLAREFGVEAAVRDLNGNLLLATSEPMPPLEPEDILSAEKGPVLIHRGRTWVVLAPVRPPDSHTIEAILELVPMRRFPTASVLRPLFLLAIILVLTGMAVFPLARRISRPVEALTQATQRFGSGELSYRIELPARPRQTDELSALQRAWNEMAERIERLVGTHRELLANVSHELRSPLARIRVALELLPDESRVRDVKVDLAELERLIEDVLTTSRLDAGAWPVRRETVDLRALLREIANRAEDDPVTQGCAIELAVEGAGSLTGDPTLLKRAVWNLVENGAKYGAPPLKLAVTRTADAVTLSVADFGEGIPEEERERVFDPFYRRDRARTPESKRTGFGLGLTLARRVAEAHGGTIGITSTTADGRGCTISLTLPA